jgi:hypothetical protein
MLRTKFQLSIYREPVTSEEITYIRWANLALVGLTAFLAFQSVAERELVLLLGATVSLLAKLVFGFLYNVDKRRFNDYEYLNQLASESDIVQRYFKEVREDERPIYVHDVNLAENQIRRERERQARQDYYETLRNEQE